MPGHSGINVEQYPKIGMRNGLLGDHRNIGDKAFECLIIQFSSLNYLLMVNLPHGDAVLWGTLHPLALFSGVSKTR
jgi:hypothetical protein